MCTYVQERINVQSARMHIWASSLNEWWGSFCKLNTTHSMFTIVQTIKDNVLLVVPTLSILTFWNFYSCPSQGLKPGPSVLTCKHMWSKPPTKELCPPPPPLERHFGIFCKFLLDSNDMLKIHGTLKLSNLKKVVSCC